jgi:outer membrane protein OmpA-like peptidoglycan-associated protein
MDKILPFILTALLPITAWSGCLSLEKGQSPFLSGTPIEVRYDGCRNATSESWIGLYKAGFKTTNDYLAYLMLDGDSGTLSFAAPKAPGDYVFVMIEKDYQAAGEPPLKFSVIEVSADLVSLKTDRKVYAPAQDVQVSLTLGSSLSDQAWLGIFPTTAPQGDLAGYLSYEYIKHGRNTPYRLRAPKTPGDYEIRVFDDHAGNQVTQVPFRVTQGNWQNLSLTTDQKRYEPQQTIKLRFTADKVLPRDAWIGLFIDDQHNDDQTTEGSLDFRYLEKRTEAELLFVAPAKKGQYRFKMVSSNNGSVIAETGFSTTRSMDSASLKRQLDRSDRVTLYGIYFDLDKSEIKSPSLPTLSAVCDLLKQYPELSLTIAGHTDNQGKAEYNRSLSARRAEAVKQHLVKVHAIAPERLSTIGYGEDRPVESNATEAGRRLNRRVELVKSSSAE